MKKAIAAAGLSLLAGVSHAGFLDCKAKLGTLLDDKSALAVV